MDCCDATPLHPMSTYEMRNLSCTIEVLGLEAFQLFEMLGEEVTDDNDNNNNNNLIILN